MSTLYGQSKGLEPDSTSPISVSFIRDYTNANWLDSLTTAINQAFLTASNTSPTIPITYVLDTLSFAPNSVNSSFNGAKSVAFNFRVYFSGTDYPNDPPTIAKTISPSSIILYNQNTGQIVHIRPSKIQIQQSATLAGDDFVPGSIVVQGCVPFHVSLNDTVILCCMSLDAVNQGKLALNFFNFDQPAWKDTSIDGLIAVT